MIIDQKLTAAISILRSNCGLREVIVINGFAPVCAPA
jgi:hypothetical protein